MLAMLLAGLLIAADPEPPAPPLPEGPLLLFALNSDAANFIELDQSSKSGSVANAWMLSVPVDRGDRQRRSSTGRADDKPHDWGFQSARHLTSTRECD